MSTATIHAPVFSRNRSTGQRIRSAEPLDRAVTSDDGALLARLTARDPEALRDAYAQHGSIVFAVAVRLLRDHQLAEECTQDVFMTLWRNAQSIDPRRARLTTWLYVVTRNHAIALDRRRRARPATPVADVPDPGTAPDPAELTAQGDDTRRIAEALATLPREQLDVMTLAYFESLTQAEIAARLDLPLGTVKSRARLALDRLRTILDPGTLAGEGSA
jgi:RNA polymerase sigma-70 factor (ECF subfamily)